MDNSGANIDLLFRNGLKDLEVLPPQGVWTNIKPVIRRKTRPFVLLRSAAMIAVVVSLAVLAYQYSRQLVVPSDNQVIAISETESPVLNVNPVAAVIPTRENRPTNIPVRHEIIVAEESAPVIADLLKEDAPLYQHVVSNISIDRDASLPDPGLALDRGRVLEYPVLGDLKSEYLTDDNESERSPRWSLSALATPTYYSGISFAADEVTRQLMTSEQARISYSGGVTFSYQLGRKLSIQSGIYYSSIGQEVGGISAYGGFQQFDYTKGDPNFRVLTSSGTIYTNNSDIFLLDRSGERVLTRYTADVFDPVKSDLLYLNGSLQQNFSYIEMPFFLRYKVFDGGFDLNLVGGLSYNLLISNSVFASSDGNRFMVGRTEGLNPFTISSSLGMGMEYSISDKVSLNLEPTFRFYLNPFTQIPGIKTHPYAFGVFSGVSYKF